MGNVVIVSRHASTAAWIIEAAGLPADVPVITGNATASDVAGKLVYGNVPMHLAVYAVAVVAVEFDSPPRGAELDAEAMEAAGARLVAYRVATVPYGINVDGCDLLPDGRLKPKAKLADTTVGCIGFEHHGPAGYRDPND